MTKIFLIRHAEAEGNLYRRMHGHYNGLVTSKGHIQIELLKKRFEDIPVDAVYSSDLQRAKDTAAAIYEPQNLRINTSDQLREVKMGVWEEKTWGTSTYYAPVMHNYFNHDPEKWHVEGGEDYHNVRRRMYEYISRAAKKHDSETIAVVSHGFAIRAFICEIKDIKSHEVDKLPYCDNTAVTLLRYENDEFDVEYYGDATHLDVQMRTLENQTWWREKTHRRGENARFEIFDKIRDKELIEIFKSETGRELRADKIYTAFHDDVQIGIVGLDLSDTNDEKTGKIEFMFVIPEFRRISVGVQLLGQAVSVFREMGRQKLQMQVQNSSPAYDFCKKYGFKVISQNNDSTCLMEKDLWSWK